MTRRKNRVYKRTKKEAYSFLQKEFKNLSKEENLEYFKEAWNQATKLGDTQLLERYTAAYVFASMSAKKGISKYGKEAEKKSVGESGDVTSGVGGNIGDNYEEKKVIWADVVQGRKATKKK